MGHKFRSTRNNDRLRQKRGVGAIIGGIILMTILVTSVLIYYLGILSADKVKESYDIQSAQASQDKTAEQLDASRSVFKNVTATYIRANMTNNGPNTLAVAYSLLYCTEGATCAPDPQAVKTFVALNPGTNSIEDMGPVTRGYTYRVDLITERGNVIATTECQVDDTQDVCRNDPGYVSPDFAIAAKPNSVVVSPGGSAQTSQIQLTSLGGYSGDVDLVVSGIPPSSGITAAPATTTLTVLSGGSPSYILSFQASASTVPGTYPITVTGTDPIKSLSHPTTVYLTVLGIAQDFAFAADPNSVVVQAGNPVPSPSLKVTSLNGFSGTVSFSSVSWSPSQPPGALASASPASVTLPPSPSNSNLLITIPAGTTPGTYTLTLTASSGSLSHDTSVSLTVLAASSPPDFMMTAFPNTMVVSGGGSDNMQLTVTSLNGFNSAVNLYVCPPNPNPPCSTSPYAGLTPSTPSPNPVTPPTGGSASSTITFTTTVFAAPGNYVYTVTGTSGSITHTIPVRVTILGPISSENIELETGLILQPQIQGIFPNLWGSAQSNTPRGLWGVVIANPSDNVMHVRNLVVTAYSPSVSANVFSYNNGCTTPPTYIIPPLADGTWSCLATNTLQWSANLATYPTGYPISAHSAKEFIVGVGGPAVSGNSGVPSFAINFNAFTDYGQFAKAGYASSMTKTNSEIASVYLSSASSCANPCTVSNAGMVGTRSVRGGNSITINAVIGNFGDAGTIKSGSRIIIDVPKGFTVSGLSSPPAGFSSCSVVTVSGQTQVSCTLSADLPNTTVSTSSNPNARTVQFTITAPAVTTQKLYTLYVLADGSDANSPPWPIGPVAENVIIVTP